MEITCDYSIIETPDVESDTDKDTSPANFADDMKITYCKYYNGEYVIDCLTGENTDTGATSLNWEIEGQDGDNEITLYDLKHDPVTDLPVPGNSLSSTPTFDMEVKLSTQAGNDVQGDTLNATMMFTLDQGPA